MNNEMLDPHLTTKIVSSYVRHHTVAANQVAELITSVHGALGRLGQPVQPQEVHIPACRCGGPSIMTMWFAWITATGAKL